MQTQHVDKPEDHLYVMLPIDIKALAMMIKIEEDEGTNGDHLTIDTPLLMIAPTLKIVNISLKTRREINEL